MQQRFPEPLALLENTYNPPPLYNSHQTQYQAPPSEVYQPYQHYQSSTSITQQLIQSPPLQSYAPTVVQQPPIFQPDTEFAIPTFHPADDPIASLNKAMIFLSLVYRLKCPPLQITNFEICLIQELKPQSKTTKLWFRMFKVDSLKVIQAMLEIIKLHEHELEIQLEMQGQIK
ncbi:hypothetical protein Tco_0192383 [Tanacetum coccineum]